MIGILGGTFDPIHNGHLRIALDAIEAVGLEQVRLIPLHGPVHRAAPHAPAAQRLAMLESAIGNQPQLIADDREIRRGGRSYMLDTLESLHRDLPGNTFCLILGDDAFHGFSGWRAPSRILQLAHVLVMQRPGAQAAPDAALQALLNTHRCCDVRSLQARDAGCIHFHSATQLDISSSDIRHRIATRRNPAFLLPDPVIDLIESARLYRGHD